MHQKDGPRAEICKTGGYFHWTVAEQQPSGLEWHRQVTCILRWEFMALGAALSKALPLLLPSQHLGPRERQPA